MIDLATAALIAKLASDAVGAFDKIFRGYLDVLKRKEPRADYIPPPDFAYANNSAGKAIVARSRSTGTAYQTVTYQELCDRLDANDRKHIESISRAMENYQHQWNTVFEQRSMASGMEIGRLDNQLEYLAKQIAETLIKVLNFVQKMGLHLDDHYLMARNVSEEYLKGDQ